MTKAERWWCVRAAIRLATVLLVVAALAPAEWRWWEYAAVAGLLWIVMDWTAHDTRPEEKPHDPR